MNNLFRQKQSEPSKRNGLSGQTQSPVPSKPKNPYWTALRPRQWTKNLIVLAAPLFGFSLNLQTLFNGLLAFFLFCCISSSFYLINDIIDVEADRKHPVKCNRPIAAGLISIPVATGMAVVLLVSSLLVGWYTNTSLGIAIMAYVLLQVFYNLRLKRTVILDVVSIAGGFVLRAYGGAVATHVTLSSWFLLCTAFLALFLGIEKRKAELRLLAIKGDTSRAVLWRYSLPLLGRMESTVTTSVVLTYAVWSSGPQVNGATTPWMILTLPFVLYGVFRYQFLSDPQEISRRKDVGQEKGGRTERPEEILLTDRPILLTVLTWITTVLFILLLKNYGVIQ